ncbi:hypothetical protein KR054_007333 [Drosophila jambulina]|nr:hypothetical protein KR054_007333 [Drosophila jambulina]
MFLFRVRYICVVVFALLGFPASAWDYCQENWCPRPNEHVACNNNGTLGTKCFKEAKLIPLNNRLRHFILHKVNSCRNEVASGGFSGFGPALRMASVRWDPELATLAELSVKRCSLSTDSCRNTRRFKHVGQLTDHVIFSALRHSTHQLLGHMIDNWFREYKRSNSQLGDKKPKSSFRQLVQERATHIGCGVLRQKRDKMWHQQFIVCNFAREDDIREPAYEEGLRTASGCRSGVNPSYPNLCALEEHYEVNALDRYHTTKSSLRIKILYSEPKQMKALA